MRVEQAGVFSNWWHSSFERSLTVRISFEFACLLVAYQSTLSNNLGYLFCAWDVHSFLVCCWTHKKRKEVSKTRPFLDSWYASGRDLTKVLHRTNRTSSVTDAHQGGCDPRNTPSWEHSFFPISIWHLQMSCFFVCMPTKVWSRRFQTLLVPTNTPRVGSHPFLVLLLLLGGFLSVMSPSKSAPAARRPSS